MREIFSISAIELVERMKSGEISCVDVCKEYLKRYDKFEKEVKACEQNQPIRILEDNTACIHMAKNPTISGRNKHMGLKIAYLREQVSNGSVIMEHIKTNKQLADFLTKNLPTPQFQFLRNCVLDPGTFQVVPRCRYGKELCPTGLCSRLSARAARHCSYRKRAVGVPLHGIC